MINHHVTHPMCKSSNHQPWCTLQKPHLNISAASALTSEAKRFYIQNPHRHNYIDCCTHKAGYGLYLHVDCLFSFLWQNINELCHLSRCEIICAGLKTCATANTHIWGNNYHRYKDTLMMCTLNFADSIKHALWATQWSKTLNVWGWTCEWICKTSSYLRLIMDDGHWIYYVLIFI